MAYTYVPFNRTVEKGRFFPALQNSTQGIVYDQSNGEMYVGDGAGNSILVFNATSGVGLTAFSFPDHQGNLPDPMPLLIDPLTGSLIVSTTNGGPLYFVNSTTGHEIRNYSFGYAAGASFDPDNGLVYIIDEGTGNLTAFNASTQTIVSSMYEGIDLFGVVFDQAANQVLAEDRYCGCLDRINPVTLRPAGTPIRLSNSPWSAVYDGRTQTIWVMISNVGFEIVNGSTGVSLLQSTVFGPSIVFDQKDNEMFVAGTPNGLAALNATTGAPVATFGSAADEISVGYDSVDDFVYVADSIPTNLSVVDAADNIVVNPNIPISPTFFQATYDPADEKVFVASVPNTDDFSDPGSVLVLDGSTNHPSFAAVHTVRSFPFQVAVDNRTGKLFLTNQAGAISVIDPTTLAITSEIPTPHVDPHGICYDWDTGDFYIADGVSNNVTILNGSTLSIANLTIPAGIMPTSCAVDTRNDIVLVSNYGSANLTVINGSTRTATSKSIPVGTNPGPIVFDPDNGMFYIADSGSDNLTIISGSTMKTVGSVIVGDGPSALSIDEGRDLLYVADSGPNAVAIVNGTTDSLVGRPIPVGPDPQGLAFDSATDQVYVSIFGAGTIQVLANLPSVNLSISPTTSEVGGPFEASAIVENGTWPMSYFYSGLPTGCISENLSSIACSPTVNGTFRVTVTVTDSLGYQSSAWRVLTILPRLELLSLDASPGSLDLGQVVEISVSVAGGVGNSTFVFSGLPAGCTPPPNTTVSKFGCKPTEAGQFILQVAVTDEFGVRVPGDGFLVVNPPLSIDFWTADPATIVLGHQTTFAAGALGGTSPIEVSYRDLPTGCGAPQSWTFSCTPTETGSFVVSVELSDAANTNISRTLTIDIIPSAQPPGPSILLFRADPNVVTVGSLTSFSLVVVNGSGPLSYTYSGLPVGCSSVSTASLSCRPNSIGASIVSVSVTDSRGRMTNASTQLLVVSASMSSGELSWSEALGLVLIGIVGGGVAALMFTRQRRPSSTPPPSGQIRSQEGPSRES